MSKKDSELMKKIESIEILKMLRMRNDVKRKIRDCVLCFIFIGVVRFRIRRKKYAEPAMQAGISSMTLFESVIVVFDSIGL
ncbi:hypothetical protein CMI46_00900 [Candidatus Pacearchaeota archaeon]|nr:hypothetical protein [Candidatus Pacearchaeota archaeon]